MKKGIIDVMLVIVVLIVVGILGIIFYQNIIKEKTEVVGGKALELIDFITTSELNEYFIRDAVRVAWGKALDDLAANPEGREWIKCIFDTTNKPNQSPNTQKLPKTKFPIWSRGVDASNLDCDPSKYKEALEKYFREHLKEIFDQKGLDLEISKFEIIPGKGFNVEFANIPLEQRETKGITMNYQIDTNYDTKIKDNFEDYDKLRGCLKKLTKEEIKNCLISVGAKLIYENCVEEVSKPSCSTGRCPTTSTPAETVSKKCTRIYEYESIINPITLEKIKIYFGESDEGASKFATSSTQEIYII